MKHQKPIPIEFRNISIPKATIDRILKTENPKDALGLYLFYYYTAIWQRTDKPHCTTKFTAKGLKCNPDTIRKNKKQLTNLGLIKDMRLTNSKGQVTGYYIHVLYYEGNQPMKKPGAGKSQGLGKQGINAYSTNSINAYSTNNTVATAKDSRGQRRKKKTFDLPKRHNITKKLPEHRLSLKLFKVLKPIVPARNNGMPKRDDNGKRIWTAWHRCFRDLLDDENGERTERHISTIIEFYGEHIREKDTPKLYSAKTFCENIHRVEMKMAAQEKEPGIKNKYHILVEGQPLYKYLDKAREIDGDYEWKDDKGCRWIISPDGQYQWQEPGDSEDDWWSDTLILENSEVG